MDYTNEKIVNGIMFEKFILNGSAFLKKNEKEINDLNVFPIPDGDTGANMFRTISGGIESMKNEISTSISKKANALASGMLISARGNSGVILSQLFSGFATGLNTLEEASLYDIEKALKKGVEKAYLSVINPVEGTILTVAREAVDNSHAFLNDNVNISEYCEYYLSNMEKSLINTPNLLDVLKEAGVVDSGGAGLYSIMQGVFESIKGNDENIETTNNESSNNTQIDVSLFTKDTEFLFGYCTEFLLRLMTKKCDVDNFNVQTIIDYLETIGDSIVAFKDGSIVKVHVHTMTPSKALEFCQNFGEFLTIKIENMMLQHNEHEKKMEASIPKVKRKRIKYASLVVTSGDGIINVFKELGADYIIDGGQGNNPSIGDFTNAFDTINADNIFVFPNNSNIILAANQASEIYKDSNIIVIPTKNVGQAYSAMGMLDYSFETPEEVKDNFISSMEYAETYLVSKAIRDYENSDVDVKTEDYIGFTNKKILCSSSEKIEVLESLCEKSSIQSKDIVTIIFGKDATYEDKKKTNDLFKTKYSKLEYYEIDGNQEIYDIIMILE